MAFGVDRFPAALKVLLSCLHTETVMWFKLIIA